MPSKIKSNHIRILAAFSLFLVAVCDSVLEQVEITPTAGAIFAISAALLVLPELSGFFEQFKSLKVGKGLFEFERDIRESQASLLKLEVDPVINASQPEISNESLSNSAAERLTKLSSILASNDSHRAKVLEAWLIVEEILNELAKTRNISVIPGQTTSLIDQLFRQGILSQGEVASLRFLRDARNRTVHIREFDLTDNLVDDFVNTALRISARLSKDHNL